MRVIAIGDDEGVDQCEECGGAFLDFFDGEPRSLAAQLIESQGSKPAPRPASHAKTNCPECRVSMSPSAYLGNGPILDYCARCMGVFVRYETLVPLADYLDSVGEEAGLMQRMRTFVLALLSRS